MVRVLLGVNHGSCHWKCWNCGQLSVTLIESITGLDWRFKNKNCLGPTIFIKESKDYITLNDALFYNLNLVWKGKLILVYHLVYLVYPVVVPLLVCYIVNFCLFWEDKFGCLTEKFYKSWCLVEKKYFIDEKKAFQK